MIKLLQHIREVQNRVGWPFGYHATRLTCSGFRAGLPSIAGLGRAVECEMTDDAVAGS